MTLCTALDCRIVGMHQADCADDLCRGCVPNMAGDGLRVCYGHADSIGANAVKAAALWGELALHLAPSGSGEGRGGNPHPSLVLNEAVVEVRGSIKGTIVSWARLIHEERGTSLPWRWTLLPLPSGVHGPWNRAQIVVDTMQALGEYVEVHGRWLAAHEAAGECVDEMAALVAAGRRALGGSGTRVIPIGPCPMVGCGGTLRGLLRTERSLLPSAVSCDTEPGHEWTSAGWMALGRSMKAVAA